MYPERKLVFNVISKEQNDGLVKLVDCLCSQYKLLYIKCRGKDAYLNFQIQWYDYLRCVASGVEIKLSKGSQVTDSHMKKTLLLVHGRPLLLLCLSRLRLFPQTHNLQSSMTYCKYCISKSAFSSSRGNREPRVR